MLIRFTGYFAEWLVLPLIMATSMAAFGSPLPADPPSPAQEPQIHSIGELRKLNASEAQKHLSTHISGVVTFHNRIDRSLFLHDGSCGIYVEIPAEWSGPELFVGDQVEVTGITHMGLFATVVTGNAVVPLTITKSGQGSLPPPRRVSGSSLMRPDADCDWVETTARVSEVRMLDGDLVISCIAENREFNVLLEGPLPPASVPWDLTESQIRVRGVVATTFNSQRQMTGRLLRVHSLAEISRMDSTNPTDSDATLVKADELLQIGGPGPDELVLIRGVVSAAVPGQGVFLQVDQGGIWVQTAQPVAASLGTVVEILGWPRPGVIKPFIRARRATVMGVTSPPQPIPLKSDQALRANQDANLVQMQGELIDSFHSPDGATLILRDGNLIFQALIQHHDLPEPLEPGSRWSITGIARITPSASLPVQVEEKLLLLPRSTADLKLLASPPWWTVRHVSIAATTIISALLVFYGIARARRLREQEAQRREFEAVVAERGRFAREIHDSLAQGLTSVSLQLECVRENLLQSPQTAAGHLEKAREYVRDSLREARRTIWNLRPLALGEADLAGTLQRYAQQLYEDGTAACRQVIEGKIRPLPHEHEAALLRIGQEALTNAAKHAQATEIRQRLHYGPDWVSLTVTDNGKGFDVAERVGKGFGLTGMHERVAALGGSLSIDSSPGEGTEVSATLPA